MINTVRLRCMLGWLGLALPWIVVILLWAFPPSISETYYFSKTITPFMIILGSSCFLLMSYKGYDILDDIVNTASGISGLGICLFPCWSSYALCEKVGTFNTPILTSNTIHCVSAVIFFALLSFNSLILFTKTGEPRVWDKSKKFFIALCDYLKQVFTTPSSATSNKKKRNIIFRICGIGMLASFTFFLLPSFTIRTWLVEAIALFFFGISFLTKANCYKFLFCE